MEVSGIYKDSKTWNSKTGAGLSVLSFDDEGVKANRLDAAGSAEAGAGWMKENGEMVLEFGSTKLEGLYRSGEVQWKGGSVWEKSSIPALCKEASEATSKNALLSGMASSKDDSGSSGGSGKIEKFRMPQGIECVRYPGQSEATCTIQVLARLKSNELRLLGWVQVQAAEDATVGDLFRNAFFNSELSEEDVCIPDSYQIVTKTSAWEVLDEGLFYNKPPWERKIDKIIQSQECGATRA